MTKYTIMMLKTCSIRPSLELNIHVSTIRGGGGVCCIYVPCNPVNPKHLYNIYAMLDQRRMHNLESPLITRVIGNKTKINKTNLGYLCQNGFNYVLGRCCERVID